MQAKKKSIVETVTNTAVGYVIAIVGQMIVFPLFDLDVQ